jgi:hypothetical protein
MVEPSKKAGHNRRYYLKHRDRVLSATRAYKQAHPEQADKVREWHLAHSERIRAIQAKYDKTHKREHAARESKRRARILKALPGWADLRRIEQIYKNCPPGYHVDHIYPLQGKEVSGLHVENNLQYLPASENCKKGNKYPSGVS